VYFIQLDAAMVFVCNILRVRNAVELRRLPAQLLRTRAQLLHRLGVEACSRSCLIESIDFMERENCKTRTRRIQNILMEALCTRAFM
jgi:hypothetical protein